MSSQLRREWAEVGG